MKIIWSKINNFNSLFLENYDLMNRTRILIPEEREVGWVRFKNRKIDGS